MVLKDKLHLEDALNHEQEDSEAGEGALAGDIQQDAAAALIALGYGSTEAQKAVRRVLVTPDTKVEDILKQALKYMV